MKFSALSFVLTIVALAVANNASAVVQEERCEDELSARRETDWIGITPELTKERHAWAMKCNYISKALVKLAEDEGMVWSFTDKTGKDKIAPWNRNAACGSYVRATMCNQGCFAADPKVLFGDSWLTLEKAFEANIGTFTSLAPDSSLISMAFQPGQKIKRYTAGLERHNLIELTVEGGRHLRVTSNHAMVGGSGELFPAVEAKVGAFLMTVDGPRRVTTVRHAPDTRRVWHISPESTDAKANIMAANDSSWDRLFCWDWSTSVGSGWRRSATSLVFRSSMVVQAAEELDVSPAMPTSSKHAASLRRSAV